MTVLTVKTGFITSASDMKQALDEMQIDRGSCADGLLDRFEFTRSQENVTLDWVSLQSVGVPNEEYELEQVIETLKHHGYQQPPHESAALSILQGAEQLPVGGYRVFPHEPIIDADGDARLFSVMRFDHDEMPILGSIIIGDRKWRNKLRFVCRV